MSKLVRAFLISAAATGVAALVVTKLQQSIIPQDPDETASGSFEVEAEALSEHEVKQLTDELGTML